MKPFWDKSVSKHAAAAAPAATAARPAAAPATNVPDFFTRARARSAAAKPGVAAAAPATAPRAVARGPVSAADFFSRAGVVTSQAPTVAQARVISEKKCPIHGTQMVPHGPSAFRCTTTGCRMIIN